jgi:ATP-binding cassette subfamily B protein
MISAKMGQIWHIRHFMTGQIFGTLLDGSTLVVLLPFLFYLNWILACFVLLIALSILGVYWLFLPSLRRAHAKVTAAEQAMGAHQVESIHGIRTIKSLSLEGMKRKERDLKVAEAFKAHRDAEFLANWPQTIVRPLEMLIYIGSFLGGGYMVMSAPDGSATYGHVMAFAMIAARVATPIVAMAGMLNAFEEARGALAEVASVVNVPPEEGRSGTGLKQPISGRIAFNNVRFRYSPDAPYALDGVTFEIPQDSIFGLMGRSGSGKTTITRLLQGLNREYEGQIKIDRMDLREIDLDHLRSNIGVVPQENFLFRGTIRENICAARPNASLDEVIRAAQLAGAEEFIERMPQGYQTYIEEGATNLSGGQRQRLAIARALLIDPPILILDEATSALDAESEAIVNANLQRIAKGRTVVIVSHRLSALAMADAILVMEQGHVYDIGPHHELIERCDIYKSLWYTQNRHILQDSRHDRIALSAPTAA